MSLPASSSAAQRTGAPRGGGRGPRLLAALRSLRNYNFRIWALGTLVSGIGTWMQWVSQDWLVLTELTHHSGTAVGVVMSLQYGPPILLMSVAGSAADRCNRRKLLLFTQGAMGVCALALGGLVLSGLVALWQVYLLAGIMGCISAFDAPARQTFVAELVGDEHLPNAVALNSSLFNVARLIGPAVAGLVIAAVGTGWAFIANAVSYIAVLAALLGMRRAELWPAARGRSSRSGLGDGLRYLRSQPDSVIALVMLFLLATYGLNFPIFISTISVRVFHGDAHLYGLLSSAMAVGSVSGALLSAARGRPGLPVLAASSAAFGVLGLLAALMPSPLSFALLLAALGAAAQLFTTSANSLVQLSTEPAMRGRVMAIYMGIFLGCTPLGAPLMGWLADVLGPRWSLAIGAASGLAAAAVALRKLRQRHAGAAAP